MLSIAAGACCDVCLEDYGVEVLPYSLPCGHVLCAGCCVNILDSDTTATLCPYCRNPFTREGVRVVRIDVAHDAPPASTQREPATGPPLYTVELPSLAKKESHDAWCNACRAMIVGFRFKCVDCPDYDICEACYPMAPLLHTGHAFARLHSREDYLGERLRVPPPEHHVHCHRCREAIVGIRYKCTHMSCVDVNLCQNCEAVPAAAPGAHSSRHQLLKIREPALDEHQPLHRHHAICDACNAPIFGVRYKCVHRDCPDFDLCQVCESSETPLHPAEHVMYKIKTPAATSQIWECHTANSTAVHAGYFTRFS